MIAKGNHGCLAGVLMIGFQFRTSLGCRTPSSIRNDTRIDTLQQLARGCVMTDEDLNYEVKGTSEGSRVGIR